MTLIWFRSTGWSPMVEGIVYNFQRRVDGTLHVGRPATEELELKEEDQVIEVIEMREPAALPELDPQVARAMRRVREAMYSVSSFHNVDFREFVDEHGLMHWLFSLDSGEVSLSDPPYHVESGCRDPDSQ